MTAQQEVARRLAALRVADHHRHDMGRVVLDRDARGLERVLGDRRHVLMALTLEVETLRWRIAAQALATTIGGSVVVKMNCGA